MEAYMFVQQNSALTLLIVVITQLNIIGCASLRDWVGLPKISNQLKRDDIALGMSRGNVAQIWGEPRFVERAGDPMSGNERWIYGQSMGTGFGNERTVYFEGGSVVGWETTPTHADSFMY
jgi:hypothetical protein